MYLNPLKAIIKTATKPDATCKNPRIFPITFCNPSAAAPPPPEGVIFPISSITLLEDPPFAANTLFCGKLIT